MRYTLRRLSIPSLIAAFLLGGCITDSGQAKGHVVENEVVAGTLYAQDGQPAADAEIKAYTVDHIPNNGLLKKGADTVLIYTFRTDAKGRYSLKALPPGTYNFLGSRNSARSYLDSVLVNGKNDSIPPDTLGLPGAIAGRVAVEPNHDPRGVYIQVLGTDYFANADSSGRFLFPELAKGQYAFRAINTLPGYVPYFGHFRVRAGKMDSMPEPIQLAFTGIPVVRGLTSDFDTVRQIARISWRAAKYPFLKLYAVYRDPAGAFVPSLLPIALTRDTVFLDTLSQAMPELWSDSPASRRDFEYRVSVRNLSGEEGLAFGSASVHVLPDDSVRSSATLSLADGGAWRAKAGSTLRVIADWGNPGRDNDSLSWYGADPRTPLRSVSAPGRSGKDTLVWRVPDAEGSVLLQVRMRDAAGSLWYDSVSVAILSGAPTVSAGDDTTVTLSDTVRLRAKAADEFGRIAKIEWDIGAGGAYVEVGGDTGIVSRNTEGYQTLRVRATGDDGQTAVDSMRVTVLDDQPTVAFTSALVPFSEGGGYRFSAKASDLGHIAKWEWDLGQGSYALGSPDTLFHPTQAVGATLACKLRVMDEDGNANVTAFKITIRNWRFEGTLDLPVAPQLVAYSGKLFAFSYLDNNLYGKQWAIFDQKTGKADSIAPFPIDLNPSFAVVDNVLYAFGARGGSGKAYKYIEGIQSWSEILLPERAKLEYGRVAPPAAIGTRFYFPTGDGNDFSYDVKTKEYQPMSRFPGGIWFESAAWNGKVYALGSLGDHSLWEYDPATDAWRRLRIYPSKVAGFGCLNGKIYAVLNGSGAGQITEVWDIGTESVTQKSGPLLEVNSGTMVAIDGRLYSAGRGLNDPDQQSVSKGIQSFDPAGEP